MDVKTGDILAMVSVPSYSLSNMEEAVSSEDSPLINRALYSYPVGSIFKLVTSAAAIESGDENFTHDCTGTVEIGTQVFGCHNREGHGMLPRTTLAEGMIARKPSLHGTTTTQDFSPSWDGMRFAA
jgi:cell division protein FtsI/penicillin-binding protein 2